MVVAFFVLICICLATALVYAFHSRHGLLYHGSPVGYRDRMDILLSSTYNRALKSGTVSTRRNLPKTTSTRTRKLLDRPAHSNVCDNTMRATYTLFANATRITLFTRSGCSLCTTAKNTLQEIQKRRPFDYNEIDVMESRQEEWKNMYEFDTPVVSITSKDLVYVTHGKPRYMWKRAHLTHSKRMSTRRRSSCIVFPMEKYLNSWNRWKNHNYCVRWTDLLRIACDVDGWHYRIPDSMSICIDIITDPYIIPFLPLTQPCPVSSLSHQSILAKLPILLPPPRPISTSP